MLRSLNKHFNESVFRGPETEGGADGLSESDGISDIGGNGDDDSTGGTDGDVAAEGDPQKPLSVREQLKKTIAEASDPDPKPAKRGKDGRFSDRPAKTVQAGQQAAPEGQQPTEVKPAGPVVAAPDSLPKEAKAEWDKTPRAVQEAFIKREQDTAQGVAALKQRYDLIDQALAPHNDALRQMNATPGEAVNRMFLWFKALAGQPATSFPALAKNMGIDWDKLVSSASGQQGQEQQGTQQGAPEIPEPVKQYVGGLEQKIAQLTNYIGQLDGRFNNVQNDLNANNEAKTRENLSLWSTGKEYFEEVRQDMAALIQTGMVPLKNGQVDLDTAYERAIYYNPEVRAKVLAKQQQANQQVQQQTKDAATTALQGQVARARKASVSLPTGTPGVAGQQQVGKRKPGQKTSVRESLQEAMAELRDQ